MTDLQLALIAVGALIISAVVLFNWWQERKLHKETASRFTEPETDVLMNEDFRIDPTISGDDRRDDTDEEEFVVRVRIHDDEPEAAATAKPYIDEPEAAEEPIARDLVAEHAPEKTLINEISSHEVSSHVELTEEELASSTATAAAYVEETHIEEAYVQETYAAEAYVEEVAEQEPAEPAEIIPASVSAPWDEPAATETAPQATSDISTDAVPLPADVDEQIDLTAILYLPRAYSGAALRQQFLNFSEIDKPVFAFGLDAFREWHLLTREQEQGEFVRCICSLQLADRSGAVSRDMLIRFQNAAEDIALNLGAQVEWQGSPDPLAYAQALDAFCIEVDKLVSLHIVQGSNGPFTGTKFRGLAEASGLVLGNDGAFHYRDEQGHTSFSLINQDSNPFNADMLRTVVIKGVVFQLDIPHVKNCTEVFNQMVLAARQMSNSLSANLVDDNYRQLTDTQIDRIRQQLKMLHAQMVTRGIMPGGQTAARLFS